MNRTSKLLILAATGIVLLVLSCWYLVSEHESFIHRRHIQIQFLADRLVDAAKEKTSFQEFMSSPEVQMATPFFDIDQSKNGMVVFKAATNGIKVSVVVIQRGKN